MQIYKDRLPMLKFPCFTRLSGKVLPWLEGINYSFLPGGKITIEPVYVSLLDIEVVGSLTFIAIHLARPIGVLVLQPAFPFVRFVAHRAGVLELAHRHEVGTCAERSADEDPLLGR